MLELKIPPVIIFIVCIGVIWMVQTYLPEYNITFTGQNWVAIACLLCGAALGIMGVFQFARKQTTVNPHKPENTTVFISTGIYSISRNPMYLGLLIVLIAGFIKWGNLFSLFILPAFIIYMNEFQIKPEERVLKEKFGHEFLSYARNTNRWLGV